MKGPKQPPEASEWPRRVYLLDYCDPNHPAYDPYKMAAHEMEWKRKYPAFDYRFFHPKRGEA